MLYSYVWPFPWAQPWMNKAVLQGQAGGAGWRSNAEVCSLNQLMPGKGAQPGKAMMGLVVEPVRESRFLCRCRDPPSTSGFPTSFCPTPGYYRLKVCSTYLESVVRVNTAPASLLQLHLRIKIFLVFLHNVGQVRTPATLCVVLLTVGVVLMMVLRKNNLVRG